MAATDTTSPAQAKLTIKQRLGKWLIPATTSASTYRSFANGAQRDLGAQFASLSPLLSEKDR